MKIDVSRIVLDYWDILCNAASGGRSYVDIFVFFVVPVIFGSISFWLELAISESSYVALITIFGIFIALLINIQVAIFGIFQRKWDEHTDPKKDHLQNVDINTRQRLLFELNASLSYLTFVSCVGLTGSFVLMFLDIKVGLFAAGIIAILSHFLLNILMVIKRSHILFRREYEMG